MYVQKSEPSVLSIKASKRLPWLLCCNRGYGTEGSDHDYYYLASTISRSTGGEFKNLAILRCEPDTLCCVSSVKAQQHRQQCPYTKCKHFPTLLGRLKSSRHPLPCFPREGCKTANGLPQTDFALARPFRAGFKAHFKAMAKGITNRLQQLQ